ncbi:MAG: hypothetical protein LBG43_06335 [Treponema sp.]|nr:hypothetical protein [Treponema sp.]
MGAYYRMNVKAISIRTAEIQGRRTAFLQNDLFLSGMLKQRREDAQAAV